MLRSNKTLDTNISYSLRMNTSYEMKICSCFAVQNTCHTFCTIANFDNSSMLIEIIWVNDLKHLRIDQHILRTKYISQSNWNMFLSRNIYAKYKTNIGCNKIRYRYWIELQIDNKRKWMHYLPSPWSCQRKSVVCWIFSSIDAYSNSYDALST